MSFVADVFAQRGNAGQQGRLQERIRFLEARVELLEHLAQRGLLVKRVAAPFEVTDNAGHRIFYVSRDRDVEYYRDGKIVAEMSAEGGGGTIWALGSNSPSRMSLTGEAMVATEDDKTRMELGRDSTQGNYRLIFFSKDGKPVSGIGESSDLVSGLAFVGDLSGNIKARIGLTKAGRSSVDVNGDNNNKIVRLTEGEKGGGVLLICSANGCDPPMVDAGDLGGFGVVRTGPEFYNPGVGLMGVPGSFLIGKH